MSDCHGVCHSCGKKKPTVRHYHVEYPGGNFHFDGCLCATCRMEMSKKMKESVL
ncbi:MAG: hypothetical protein ACFFD4_02225 [Candidatus Odinarchaeota archaeon]